MKPWIGILLAVSLIANIALITFGLTIHLKMRRFHTLDGRIALMEEKFSLRPEQTGEILQASRDFIAELERIAPKPSSAESDFLTEGTARQPDFARVETAIISLQAREQASADARRRLALRILKVLEPEQRRQLLETHKRRPAPPNHLNLPPLGPVLSLLPDEKNEGFPLPPD